MAELHQPCGQLGCDSSNMHEAVLRCGAHSGSVPCRPLGGVVARLATAALLAAPLACAASPQERHHASADRWHHRADIRAVLPVLAVPGEHRPGGEAASLRDSDSDWAGTGCRPDLLEPSASPAASFLRGRAAEEPRPATQHEHSAATVHSHPSTARSEISLSTAGDSRPWGHPDALEPRQTGSAAGGGGMSRTQHAARSARRSLRAVPRDTVQVTEVRTAEDLRSAVADGAAHISVQQHLDFSALTLLRRLRADWAIGFAPTTVQSIQGNCTAPPPATLLAALAATPPLLPLQPGQCLLVAPANMLAARGQLWLDNLYLRVDVAMHAANAAGDGGNSTQSDDAAAAAGADGVGEQTVQVVAVADAPGGGELWMTGSTIQGPMHPGHALEGPVVAATGLQVTGRAFASGCTFANLGGTEPAVQVTRDGSSAAFTNCTFSHTAADPAPAADGGATSEGPPHKHTFAAAPGTAIRLDNCTFDSGAPAAVHLQPGRGAAAAVYSTNSRSVRVLSGAAGGSVAAEDVAAAPDGSAFLAEDDAWFVQTQQILAARSKANMIATAPQPLLTDGFGSAAPYLDLPVQAQPIPAPALAPAAVGPTGQAVTAALSDNTSGSGAVGQGVGGGGSPTGSVAATPLAAPRLPSEDADAAADIPAAEPQPRTAVEQRAADSVRAAAASRGDPGEEPEDIGGGGSGGVSSRGVALIACAAAMAAVAAVIVAVCCRRRRRRMRQKAGGGRGKVVFGPHFSASSEGSHVPCLLRDLSPLPTSRSGTSASSSSPPSGRGGAAETTVPLTSDPPETAAHAATSGAGETDDVVPQSLQTPARGTCKAHLSHSTTLPLPPGPAPAGAGLGMHELLDAALHSHAALSRSTRISPALTHTDISESLEFMAGPPSLKILNDISRGLDDAPSSELYTEDLPGTTSIGYLGSDSYGSSQRTSQAASELLSELPTSASSASQMPCSETATPLFSPCGSGGCSLPIGPPLRYTGFGEILREDCTHPEVLRDRTGGVPGSVKGALEHGSTELPATTGTCTNTGSCTNTDVSVTVTSATTATTGGQTALTVYSTGEPAHDARAACAAHASQAFRAASAAHAARAARAARDAREMKRRFGPGDSYACMDRLEFIAAQLESYSRQRQFMPGLVLLGTGRRRQGGQAIVQIARVRDSGREVAVKLYASRRAYEADAARSSDARNPLHALMPRLRRLYPNTDIALRDVCGNPLPPFIVMDKAEPLDTYCSLHQPRRSEAFTMIVSIARVFKDLHAAGYAHRNLDPRHIMWLPHEQRWTLGGLNSVARMGVSAPLPDALSPNKKAPSVPVYAAPEAVFAARHGAATMRATHALDAWALGVLVIELLAGQSVFKRSMGRDAVMSQIAADGGRALPWENRASPSVLLATLGPLRDPVLGLLCRDPDQRLPMHAFVQACEHALAER
eukprot:jgi/Ulvmu1/6316/UM029_0024.1